MPYVEKKIITPHRVIVKKYHTSRYGQKGVLYRHKWKPTPEEMLEAADRRREEKLALKIEQNFDTGDWHLVLTYRKEERPDPDTAVSQVKKCLRVMRREYKKLGKELKYVWVAEHLKTSIHHHIIINECGQTGKLVREHWPHGTPMFTPIWENGEVAGLAKYIRKESKRTSKDPDTPVKKSYSCSRNLKEPEEKTRIIRASHWRDIPRPPKGYEIQKGSLREGINPMTGYPYQTYVMVKAAGPPERKKDGKGKNQEENRKRKGRSSPG